MTCMIQASTLLAQMVTSISWNSFSIRMRRRKSPSMQATWREKMRFFKLVQMKKLKLSDFYWKEVKTNVCSSRTALPMLNERLLPESALPSYDPKGDRSQQRKEQCMWSRWWLCHQWSEIDLVSFKLFSTNCFTKSATLVCRKLYLLSVAGFTTAWMLLKVL